MLELMLLAIIVIMGLMVIAATALVHALSLRFFARVRQIRRWIRRYPQDSPASSTWVYVPEAAARKADAARDKILESAYFTSDAEERIRIHEEWDDDL